MTRSFSLRLAQSFSFGVRSFLDDYNHFKDRNDIYVREPFSHHRIDLNSSSLLVDYYVSRVGICPDIDF